MPNYLAPPVEIFTARAVMEPFAPKDADDVFDGISPEITRFMAWEPPPTRGAFEAVWQAWLPGIATMSDIHLVARAWESGRFLGILGFHAARSTTPELGIWLRSDVQGRGLGRELVTGLVGWASRTTAINHFMYPVAVQNRPSRRIAEALGGQVVGRRSNAKYEVVVYHIPPTA